MADSKEDRTTLAPGEVAELRAKKANARRAQRSAATKAVNQLESVIECRDNRRLRQARQTLTEKIALLTRLDAEILDLTDESGMEAEVIHADEVKSKLTLALIDIDDALGSDQDVAPRSCDHALPRCDSRNSTVTPQSIPVTSTTTSLYAPSTTPWFPSSLMTGLENLSLSNQASQSTVPTLPFGHHSVTTPFGNTVTTTSSSFSRATSVRFTLPQFNTNIFRSTPGAAPTHLWDAVPNYSNSTAQPWTAPDSFTPPNSNAGVSNFTPNVSTNPWTPVSHQLNSVTHSSHSAPLGTQHTVLSFPTVATTTRLPTLFHK